MVRVFYSPSYVGSGFAFDTTRKARWIADSLVESPIPGIELVEPAPLTRELVADARALEYVRSVSSHGALPCA